MEPEKLREYLGNGAVLVVLSTPFTKDNKLNVEGLRENTRFLVEKRDYGPLVLIPVGSTGEHYTLTEEERNEVVRIVVEEAGGKIPIIAHTGHSGTDVTIRHGKYVEDIGADGVMIVLPYYHVPGEEGMYQHYEKIAEATNIGVLVYNNPDVSKVYIQPHLMKRIAEIPNIVGVKENTPYLPTFYEQVKAVGEKIPVFNGRGEWWFVASVLFGARGYISAYANFMPEFTLDLLKAGLNGNFVELKEMMKKLDPYEEFIARMCEKDGPTTTILPYPYVGSYMVYSVMKQTMDILGLHGGDVRLPLTNIKNEDKKELEEIVFEKLGLRKIK